MTGLLEYARDLDLPRAAGEPELCPPHPNELIERSLPSLLCRDRSTSTARVFECALLYARWKPGVSTTACYRVVSTDTDRAPVERLVVWRRHCAAKWNSAANGRDALDKGRLGDQHEVETLQRVEDERTALWVHTADPELPGIARLFDVGRFARWFDEADVRPGWRVRRKHDARELLRYRPTSRAVIALRLRLMGPNGEKERVRWAARVLRPKRARSVAERRLAFERCSEDALLLPRLIGYEERTGTLYEEWIDGRVRAHPDHGRGELAGEVLARLHATPCDERARRTARTGSLAHAERTAPWFEPFGLEGTAASATAEKHEAWCHRDFHPDCVVEPEPDRDSALLDGDSIGLADPRTDLATWIAGALDPSTDTHGPREAAIDALLDGYHRAGGKIAVGLADFVARELEARAAASIRRLEVGAVESARALLGIASQVRRELEP